MSKPYNGKIIRKEYYSKSAINIIPFIYWIGSLIVSLLPLYISMFKYYAEHQNVDSAFWRYSFVKGDILWVFATVLLFVIIDSFSTKNLKKNSTKVLCILGIILFLFVEATWILFNNYDIKGNGLWPVYLGIILISLVLIISTPLKINLIKEEK